jgi:hypothetical protein
MREQDIKVRTLLPKASEATKLEKHSLVQHFYVGKPLGAYEDILGSKARLQINDAFAEMDEIDLLANQIQSSMDPQSFEDLRSALKIDKEVKMGMVTELKSQLRKNNLRKVSYLAIGD